MSRSGGVSPGECQSATVNRGFAAWAPELREESVWEETPWTGLLFGAGMGRLYHSHTEIGTDRAQQTCCPRGSFLTVDEFGFDAILARFGRKWPNMRDGSQIFPVERTLGIQFWSRPR